MNHSPYRISLIGPSAPWRGGIAQYVDGLSDALTTAGHAVRILSFSRQYPSLVFPGASQVEPGATPRPEARHALDSINPWTWVREGRTLARWRPDLVVAMYWLPFFAPMVATLFRTLRRPHTRLVLDCHNVEPHETRPLDGMLTNWVLGTPDRFLVHSNAVVATLKRRRPDAVTTVAPLPLPAHVPAGPGRAIARQRLGLSPDAPVLLFFGFVRAYKGLDIAIEAMADLPADTRLVVAGEVYEQRSEVRGRAAEIAPDRVHFVESFIPTEDVGVYFDAADVVVLPYRHATQSGVLPLAWRFGVPAVATAVGGLPELIRPDETGILVPPEDPRAFAAGVTRALDLDVNARIRAALADVRDELSWEQAAQTVVGLKDA